MRPFVAVLSAVSLLSTVASAAELTVFTPGAVQTIVREVAKDYERKTGNTVRFEFGTAGALAQRVAGGERGDVIIATAPALAALAKSGHVVATSIRDLGSMGVGVAVRKGAARPDIHDLAAFKAAMLAAKSIMFADPAKGAQSGIHVAKVLAELGIDKELQPRLQIRDRGPDGLKEVAAGKIEIGLGQISEILANKDVDLVGPLPAPIQGLVTFSASLHASAKENRAAQELIDMLVAPEAKERFRQAGFVTG
jgi:molybdate transport system substrate-binding protein